MSPMKRPSGVDGLRRAVAPAPAATSAQTAEPAAIAVRTKPVRITVDLSPADYEALSHWIGSAATRVNPAPGRRITLAKAMRAMIHATIADELVTVVVLDLLRQESE